MKPIPPKHKEKIASNPFYKKCVNCGSMNNIEIHHTFGQISEMWNYIPLCVKCHRGNFGTINKKAKERAEYESIMRLIESGFENLDKYQKPMDNTWENRINFYLNHYIK